jgi:hypothetical protein
MPTYITRNIQDYPTEFYRCPANPEGLEFICFFCSNLYKTKSACISHMKKCCRDEDMEYSDYLEVDDSAATVDDYHRSHIAESTTIKTYITNNELASLTELPSNEIIEKIKIRLLENGFHDNECKFNLLNTSFRIYKFFFIVSDEEKSEFLKKSAEEFCKKYFDF